jgi:[ribosomal protein S18]-alanine N-acetyltransferase
MKAIPTPLAQTRVHIRWLIQSDMHQVLAIEHASFEHPWCEEEFSRTLRQRNCIGMVAELSSIHDYVPDIAGFMVYEFQHYVGDRRRVKTRNIQILDFAVRPGLRRRGAGRQMAAHMKTKCSATRPGLAVLVRETDLPAQYFWRAMGFRATLVVRGHYRDTGEDAYEMFYKQGGGS